MATVEIKNTIVYYEEKGQGEPVLLLHGWRQNTTMMQFIQDDLAASFHVFNLDFPGFGQSSDPQEPWDVKDYMEFLHEFVEHFRLTTPILIGHSFGCRVAIHYAAKYGAKKMVLTGAAGIKPKRGVDYYAKVYTYKAGKKLSQVMKTKHLEEKIRAKAGSDDYKQATGVMKDTFVKVVNDDVTDLLPQVTCPTILIWGENDEAVPLWMGQEMEAKMKDAALVVFDNDDHYAYFHQPARFLSIVHALLEPKGEKENV